jgi:hypothetical protein
LWCDLGNPRPATDFPRPPPQIFCGVTKWKNVFLPSWGWFALLFMHQKQTVHLFNL